MFFFLSSVANPCDSAECNPTSLCLLSPSSPEGYTCVCTDEDEGCVGMCMHSHMSCNSKVIAICGKISMDSYCSHVYYMHVESGFRCV